MPLPPLLIFIIARCCADAAAMMPAAAAAMPLDDADYYEPLRAPLMLLRDDAYMPHAIAILRLIYATLLMMLMLPPRYVTLLMRDTPP